MEVLPREISVGEVAVFKMPIGAIRYQGQEILHKAIDFSHDKRFADGLMKEAGLLVVPEQENPVYLSSNNIQL
jgi:hypothetical protein